MKPIYEELKKFAESELYPFCMPGHKKGLGIDFRMNNPFEMDITEIDNLDNLHHPTGIIKESQELAAKTFGADNSYYLVNGSTSGLEAAVLSVCGDSDEIIVARNCHKSVYNGIILSGAKPIYIYPQYMDEKGYFGGVSSSEIEKSIIENPESKAVIITSPTYEGIVSDVQKIAYVVHKYNKILIVDEAHGAHFKFNNYFPKTALECGADIVIQSLHKTLPAPTQTAIIHTKGDRVNVSRLKSMISMMQSTSPSYIFMAAIDLCMDYLRNKGKKDFEDYVNRLKIFRTKVKDLKMISLLDLEVKNTFSNFDLDLGKLVFNIRNCDLNAIDVAKILRDKYNIQIEMSDENHFIAMSSVSDSEQGFTRLYNALKEIDSKMKKNEEKERKLVVKKTVPKMEILPREAIFSEKSPIKLEHSQGHICGEFVVPYPPGIPLLVPGEIIEKQVLDEIFKMKFFNIDIVGTEREDLEEINIILK